MVVLGLSVALFSSADATTILPETFLREYDPVTILFPHDVGPAEGGPLDDPGALLSVDPPVHGEFRFVDARTIQFRPADQWRPLQRFEWKAGNARQTLYTMMMPPQRMIPTAGKTDLESFRDLTLNFRAPIDIQSLASMISFEVRPLPGIERRDAYWLTSADYDIKPLQRGSSEEPMRYLITLHQTIGGGHSIALHIRLSSFDDDPSSFVRYEFFTREPFRIISAGIGGTAYPPATLTQ